MKPDEIFSVGTLKAAGRSTFYLLNFAHFFNQSGKSKGVITAIFISHFMYWEGKQEDESEPGSEWSGWIYKSTQDINKETGLGRYGMEAARAQLVEMGILEEKRAKLPARLFYRFNWAELERKFTKWYREHDETPIDRKKKKPKPQFEEGPKAPSPEKVLQNDMVKAFDILYLDSFPIGFAWMDKEFFALSELKKKFKGRLEQKNKGEPITNEMILASWIAFLSKLTDTHKKKWLSPTLLNSNFNNIIRDLSGTITGNKNDDAFTRNESSWVS